MLHDEYFIFFPGVETLVLVVVNRATVGIACAAATVAVAAGHQRAKADEERAEQVDDVPTFVIVVLV